MFNQIFFSGIKIRLKFFLHFYISLSYYFYKTCYHLLDLLEEKKTMKLNKTPKILSVTTSIKFCEEKKYTSL